MAYSMPVCSPWTAAVSKLRIAAPYPDPSEYRTRLAIIVDEVGANPSPNDPITRSSMLPRASHRSFISGVSDGAFVSSWLMTGRMMPKTIRLAKALIDKSRPACGYCKLRAIVCGRLQFPPTWDQDHPKRLATYCMRMVLAYLPRVVNTKLPRRRPRLLLFQNRIRADVASSWNAADSRDRNQCSVRNPPATGASASPSVSCVFSAAISLPRVSGIASTARKEKQMMPKPENTENQTSRSMARYVSGLPMSWPPMAAAPIKKNVVDQIPRSASSIRRYSRGWLTSARPSRHRWRWRSARPPGRTALRPPQ